MTRTSILEMPQVNSDCSECLEWLSRHSRVVFDFETAKTETFEGKYPLGVAIGIPHGLDIKTWYIYGDDLALVLPALQGKELIAHNIGFDLEILEQAGVKHHGPIWDTMIMAHLANENRMSYELDHLALMLLKERKADMKPLEKIFVGWEKIPPALMGAYAVQDIVLTYKLFTKLYADLQHQKLLDLWPDAEAYIRTLQQVKRVGLDIDWNLLASLREAAAARIDEIQIELGFDPAKPSQLVDYLFVELGMTPTGTKEKSGRPHTDDAALRELAERNPAHAERIALIQEFRNRSKALSTWYDGFAKRRGATNRLYPGLKQHGTRTGRLSCAEPNLQQLPRDGGRVKKVFVDRAGYRLVEFDYSQIELRVASWYAKGFDDPRMFDTYTEGADVHTLTAELVGAFNSLENKKEARQVGKTGNFLWIYGGSARRLQSMMWNQYNIHVTLEQAISWTEAFHTNYPGFRRAIRKTAYIAEKQGSIRMWHGRRRRLDSDHAHNAFNAVVQGGCAAVLMKTMNHIREQDLPSLMCNTVHDSIWFYVPEDELDSQIAEITRLMRLIPEEKFGLPFEVDYKLWTQDE